MLSYIYQLAYRFERSHNLKANVLYLNPQHFDHLRQEFSDPDDIEAIAHYLGMHLILSHEALHPHVAHQERSWNRAATQHAINHQHKVHQTNYQ